MSLVVVVSGQRLLWDGAQLVGSHLQGPDKWHPLHFGVSPEWLWDSAPASSPWWCGLLQLRECSPGQSFPFAWALLGVTLKLVLRFLWKWGGPYTPDLDEAQCWFLTKLDVLWPWTLLLVSLWELGGPAFSAGTFVMIFPTLTSISWWQSVHWQGDYGFFWLSCRLRWPGSHEDKLQGCEWAPLYSWANQSMVHLRSMASSEACLEVGELFPPSWTKEPKERSLKRSLEKLLNLSPSLEKTLN